MKFFCVITAVLVAAVASCERHSWEETKALQEPPEVINAQTVEQSDANPATPQEKTAEDEQ